MQLALGIHGSLYYTTFYKGLEHLNFGICGRGVGFGGWEVR